jgi:tryptophan halogenase
MATAIKKIVVVGGGSAGWLTAAIVAAEHCVSAGANPITVTLVESKEIATIGVGEGTWPSMRETIRKIGISEAEFITACDASFKQGSKFVGWSNSADGYYYHPFTLPAAYGEIDLVPHWQQHREGISFADAVCPQGYVCDRGLAPKQARTPEFAYNLNYGYHLNAGKFTELLCRHSVKNLGVVHIQDDVSSVVAEEDGSISALRLKSGSSLEGDIFVDCTGFHALLIGKHFAVPYLDKKNILFNDCALAVPVPYVDQNEPIASCTTGTARSHGWIWDIGLSSRRGVGYVYSSSHTSDDEAQRNLEDYIGRTGDPSVLEKVSVRKIKFSPGYRSTFWKKNCVAIGLSAGFIEPLEATALALIEQSAQTLAEELPADSSSMAIVAKRFNQKFQHHWERIIDFLKLHYVLSQRTDTSYWHDHRADCSVPESLQELLTLWKNRSPWVCDSYLRSELFPSASFQYVLYGMQPNATSERSARQAFEQNAGRAGKIFQDNIAKAKSLTAGLPCNRELINYVKAHGFGRG